MIFSNITTYEHGQKHFASFLKDFFSTLDHKSEKWIFGSTVISNCTTIEEGRAPFLTDIELLRSLCVKA